MPRAPQRRWFQGGTGAAGAVGTWAEVGRIAGQPEGKRSSKRRGFAAVFRLFRLLISLNVQFPVVS